MKKQGSIKESLFATKDGGWLFFLPRAGVILLVALTVLVAPPRSGKGAGQALAEPQAVSIDLSEGTLAVRANLVKGQLLNIEVMDSEDQLVVDLDSEDGAFT